MKMTTVLGFGAIGFGLLALLTIVLAGGWIENDLAERGQEELEAVGESWATIEMNGRSAVLSGTAPAADAAQQALDAVAAVWGVDSVDDQITRP